MKVRLLKQSPRLGLMVGTFVVPLVVFTIGVAWQYTKAMEQEMLAHARGKGEHVVRGPCIVGGHGAE